jgi:hypothetical protein
MNGSTNAKRIKWVGLGLALMVTFGLGYYASRARAAGIPQAAALVYSGTLTDGTGAPLTGSKNVLLQVYGAASGGAALCQSMPTTVNLVGGTFRVPLGDDCAAVVHSNPDLFIDVLVDGASVGRAKLGAVPYAVEADTAQRAVTAATGGALDTQIAALATRMSALEALSHTIGGHTMLGAGSCSVAAPCVIDISRGAFHTAPACTVTMANNDGTGYSELMVVQSVSTTALRVWKGQFYTQGSTMDVYYVCTGT